MRRRFPVLLLVSMTALIGSAKLRAQNKNFKVTLDNAIHGAVQLSPALPDDGLYPAGTQVTVTATPDKGYVLDSVYFSVPGPWGPQFHESPTSPFTITIDRDKHLGASFIEKSAVDHVDVTQDVVYAKPGVKPLKYDVYSPKGANSLPCIVIIHGGGWVSNSEDIMRGLARELTKTGDYVVFSIDYRWAGKADGDPANNTMADLIGDVFGAIAHIMEHAPEYGGDPARIALTGDSAGGHLSAAAALMANLIGDGGFGRTPGVFEFKPSYLPGDKSLADVRTEMLTSIKAAAPSYGVFGGSFLNNFSFNPAADNAWTDAVSPIRHVPSVAERAVPMFLTRGTNDPLIKDEMVSAFKTALEEKGQKVEYVQVEGAGHAFFDWKPDEVTKATFARYGVPYAAAMKSFFDSVFRPEKAGR